MKGVQCNELSGENNTYKSTHFNDIIYVFDLICAWLLFMQYFLSTWSVFGVLTHNLFISIIALHHVQFLMVNWLY